jgi:hypothetical protein
MTDVVLQSMTPKARSLEVLGERSKLSCKYLCDMTAVRSITIA